MRVTLFEMYRNFLSNLETLNANYSRTNQQISSGKKLNQLSDSPAGSAELVSLTELSSEIDMYRSNLDTSSYFLQSADSALSEVNNILTSIFARGSEAATETVSDEGRAAIATEVRMLRDQVLSLANSQVRGRYIFAGSKTLSAPFELTGDSVVYVGDEDTSSVAVNEGVEVKAGVPGAETFNSVCAAINSLLTALDGNDLSAIKTALGQFSTAFSELGQARGQIGSNLSVLENIATILNSRDTDLKSRRSTIEDANLAEAAVQLNQIKTALDAALSAGGSILSKPNLFDILG